MRLEFKLYQITVLYCLGATYMLFFPPRNFKRSGAKMRMIRSVGPELTYKKFVDNNDVVLAAERMVREAPDVSRLQYLAPKTAQNRSLVALELQSDMLSTKPGILVIAALNGMAWGAPNAVLELAEKLLYDTNYQSPFFNDYDWYLIPMANPDGLNFTQSQRHLPPLNAKEWAVNLTARATTRADEWHKNVDTGRSAHSCFGTNINRNFAFHWQDDVSKSPDRCSQWFPGDRPFSTNEARAIRKYVDGLGETIQLAVHLHASFVPKKEYMVYPWRYTLRMPSNHYTLQDIGEYAARLSRQPDGRVYEVHQSSNDGRVAGSVIDYLSGVVGTDLVYLLKPYHKKFPDYKDVNHLKAYVDKSTSAILSLVRGWRRSTKQNTLTFFGVDVEF
ncbi:carboxypeptidase B-like isoform X1 [Leguminivora glycinivorella]|uniref:carboxypeptidase B-like isoform X1 n=2 Tax=Leguminivora glycinivorella TaxID=1035111 RepID=UPI00200BFC22|nr:carboxypeptidase B-like isoform X1 [Leguminivora glycinivorella]